LDFDDAFTLVLALIAQAQLVKASEVDITLTPQTPSGSPAKFVMEAKSNGWLCVFNDFAKESWADSNHI